MLFPLVVGARSIGELRGLYPSKLKAGGIIPID